MKYDEYRREENKKEWNRADDEEYKRKKRDERTNKLWKFIKKGDYTSAERILDIPPADEENRIIITRERTLYEIINDYESAVSNAKNIKQELIYWIDTSDKFTPFITPKGIIVDEWLVKYRIDLSNWVSKINPQSPESRKELTEYIKILQKERGLDTITLRLMELGDACNRISNINL